MNLFDCAERKPAVSLKEVKTALQQAKIFACDLETSGLSHSSDRITIVALACENEQGEIKGWSLDTQDYPMEVIRDELFDIFHDKEKICVFHNANFDVKFLNKYGIYSHNKLADTMIMVWLFDEDRIRHQGYGLKHCVLKYLNYQMSSYEDARSLFGNFESYAADDAVQTLKLFKFLEKELSKLGLMSWFWQVEMPIAQILIEVETRGVCLDKNHLKLLKSEAWKELDKLEASIYQSVGYKFDVGSPKQWAKVLFDELKIGMHEDGTNEFSHRSSVTDRKSGLPVPGEWSTANSVLEAIKRSGYKCSSTDHDKCGHEIARKLLDYREINTRQNTFIKPLLERCVDSTIIHPKFIQIGTVTGRFASKDPNYQNLPREGGIRRAFIARLKYKIIRADFSQAELRLMAHMSNDPIMISIYKNNGDIHQTTADACRISRQAAKACNFGLIYRMSAARLQEQLALQGTIISIEDAYKYIKNYFKTYREVRNYHKKVEDVALKRLEENGEYGYVRTLGGRYRKLDRNYLTIKETAYTAITQLINTTIQGGVSDLIKVAMVDCQNYFKKVGWLNPEKNIWDAYIQGQVHDELFIECREDLAEQAAHVVRESMENAGRKYKIRVPMTADAKIVDNLSKE